MSSDYWQCSIPIPISAPDKVEIHVTSQTSEVMSPSQAFYTLSARIVKLEELIADLKDVLSDFSRR